MWKIIQELTPILLVILLLSQYVIPVLLNQEKWWLFKIRKNKNKIPVLDESEKSLTDEVEEVKSSVNETKTKANIVKAKVDKNYKSAEDLKKETDNLI